MNILFVVYGWPPFRNAGADIHHRNLAQALADAGHSVTVLIGDVSVTSRVNDPIQLRPDRESSVGPVDVVITLPEYTSRARYVAERRGARLVAVVNNVSRPANPTGAWSLVCWNSVSTRAAHRGRGGAVVRPLLTLPDRPTPGDAVTLINLSEDKGARVFWELAARNPTMPFLGVTSWGVQMTRHPDGIECPNVTILDHLPHERMREVWDRTGVLLAPSKFEAWGMAACEAMAHRISVIAHPTPGLVESLGGAGLFADRSSPAVWQTRLEDVLVDGAARDRVEARAAELATLTRKDLGKFVTAIEALA